MTPIRFGLSRREYIQKIGTGLGVLGMAGIMASDGALGADSAPALSDKPLAPKLSLIHI